MKKEIIYITESFEKSNVETKNSFKVDELLTDIIITLNKKGYKTLNSCSGHYREDTSCREASLKADCTKEELMKFLNENNLKFLGEDEEKYYFETKVLGSNCYIMFDEDIILPFYPDKFDFNSQSNTVSYQLLFYEDEIGQQKKTKVDLDKEIKELINILETWANKLP